MHDAFHGRIGIGVLVLGLLAFTGCDSGSDDGGTLSESALQDMSSMMTRVQTVLGNIGGFGFGFGKAPTGDQLQTSAVAADTYPCEGGGSVTYDGGAETVDETSTTFSFSTTFDDCEGIDGQLDYSGMTTIEVTESAFNYEIDFRMDGSLTEACALSFENYGAEVALDGSAYRAEYHGGFSGTCGNESFTCSLDGISMTYSDEDDFEADEDLFAEYCS